jgi:hypothetical protein
MDSLGVIANPYSKSVKADPFLTRKLTELLSNTGSTLVVTQDLEHLVKVLSMFKDKGITTLGVVGGDGTIAQTLTAAKKVYGTSSIPQVLVLGGGTMNVLKLNLRIKGSPYKLLKCFLTQAHSTAPLKTISISTLTDGINFGFLFGCGVIATYLERFYQKKTGALGALGLTLKFLGLYVFDRAKYFRIFGDSFLSLKVDDSPILAHRDRCAVMASTIERMPLGPKFFPFARSKPSKFQYFFLEYGSLKLPLKLVFVFLFTGLGSRFGRTSGLASSLVLDRRSRESHAPASEEDLAELSQRPSLDLPYTIDGELFAAKDGKLQISIGFEVQFVLPT